MPASRRITMTALGSIAVGIVVLLLKLAAWWWTGSIAILSDALESIVNVAAALIAFFAVRVASAPPDANHPFGHQKAEFLAAVAEATLVVLAALLIVWEAVEGLLSPIAPEFPLLGVAAIVVATLLNLAWAQVLIRRGRRYRSPALEADGRHLMTDVVTSLGVCTGLALVALTGFAWLDAALALAVGVVILWSGWRMMRRSAAGLMDETADPDFLSALEETVTDHLGTAIEAHDLKVRPLGRSFALEMHLVVPGTMSVDEAHRICDRIEDALEEAHGITDAIIHVEPTRHAKGEASMIFGE
ncbi:MAG: cation diffusion facilitator family transporter [Rubricella sp.]